MTEQRKTPEEVAHIPTDDEREALIALKLASFSKRMSDGYPSIIMRTNEEAADLVLAAGFRLSEVPEPSAEDCPDGWFVFGSHAPYPWVGKMEFSAEKDEAGMPLWERPVQGEPSDDYEAGYAEGFHHGLSSPRGSAERDREQGEPSDAQEAEIAARALDRVAADFSKTEGLGLTSDALWWWSWFAEMLGDKATMLRTEAAALRAAWEVR